MEGTSELTRRSNLMSHEPHDEPRAPEANRIRQRSSLAFCVLCLLVAFADN